MALTPFDFQQARVKLVLFKSRLRSVLYGVREAEPGLFSMRDNLLAQWLHDTLQPVYGTNAEVRELERVLQQMLAAGQNLARRYERGQIEEARAGLEQINGFAARLEELLLQAEQNLGSLV